MLTGIERCVDLCGPKQSGMTNLSLDAVQQAILTSDTATLGTADGHFAAIARDRHIVRLARTIGEPLRYFVAKMHHGPFLVVAERMDTLFDWCRQQGIAWQFDPSYTRMVPAHYLLEIEQIGCPDPAPKYTRFFHPAIGSGPADTDELGATYARAALDGLRRWIESLPHDAPVGVSFSGGIDSTAVAVLARHALEALGRDASRLRLFTLDLGAGDDARQAEKVARDLGFDDQWERVVVDPSAVDFAEAIRVIEDYHPLDVECAAVGLALLGEIRNRYPSLTYLLDGDGGDENLKSYPLEDSDLTISSVLKNPLLYQEGWGVDALKHSQTYSGGLSRSYVRTAAPARHFGFDAFSPFTTMSTVAAALAMPFESLVDGAVERLYEVKGHIVPAGVFAVTGHRMPANPKRRFQDGAGGEANKRWKLDKAWCRRTFLRQWQDRLERAWQDERRVSGNDTSAMLKPHDR